MTKRSWVWKCRGIQLISVWAREKSTSNIWEKNWNINKKVFVIKISLQKSNVDISL